MNTVNKDGIDLIKHYESLHDGDLTVIGLQPKMCPAGIWTVGYGHALRDNVGNFLKGYADKEEAYRQYPNLSVLEAENLLANDIRIFSYHVERKLKHKATDNEFSAMVSLAYNIGIGGFSSSSVLRFFNANDTQSAADAFMMWTKAKVGGVKKVLPGLVNRRGAEKALFLKG